MPGYSTTTHYHRTYSVSQIDRVTDGASAIVLAKIEGRNPAYSVKMPHRGGNGVGRGEERSLARARSLSNPTSATPASRFVCAA